jgi:hypothetical protein
VNRQDAKSAKVKNKKEFLLGALGVLAVQSILSDIVQA